MSHSFIYKEGALGDWKDCEDRRLKKNLDK